jgi:hypothetical protein
MSPDTQSALLNAADQAVEKLRALLTSDNHEVALKAATYLLDASLAAARDQAMMEMAQAHRDGRFL